MKTIRKMTIVAGLILALTCPTTAQVANLGIAPAGGQSLLYWPAGDGLNYSLETVTNLASTNWTAASTAYGVNAALVTNANPSGYYRLKTVTPPAGMVLIPAGWFLMGDSVDGGNVAAQNFPPTNIYVSGFFMETNLVTYGLWTNVFQYATNHGYTFGVPGAGATLGANYPVFQITWVDSVVWCNARSERDGLTPVYYADAAFTQLLNTYSQGASGTIFQNLNASGYRLPTEAEWEKAARGGGVGRRFPWGNLIRSDQAQYLAGGSSPPYDLGPAKTPSSPSPVGSYDVNGYGLYDMCGNLWQCCWDFLGPLGQPSNINPTGATSGNRVIKGGSWQLNALSARTGWRNPQSPTSPSLGLGLRCVRGL